jgi:hypothetical protein
MDEGGEEGAVFDHGVKDVGEMISPAPPRDFAPVLGTAANAKFRWGAGRIILPALLCVSLIRTAPGAR